MSLGYFSKFDTPMALIREAVADNYANYAISDQMKESATGRVVIGDTVFTHGSKEPIPGQVRQPGTRREGKGPARKQRWAKS